MSENGKADWLPALFGAGGQAHFKISATQCNSVQPGATRPRGTEVTGTHTTNRALLRASMAAGRLPGREGARPVREP
jgi:hypothetical protein